MANDDGRLIGGQKLWDPAYQGTRGSYALSPAGTPKYAPGNDLDSLVKQARLFLSIPNMDTYVAYRDAAPRRAQPFLDVLETGEGGGGLGYVDFILSQINESYSEKFQVSEVLSDAFISYFFGQSASVWPCAGNLINTEQDDWYNAWHVLYQDVLRGSQLARGGMTVRLLYNDRIVEGALLNMSTGINSQQETAPSFNFNLLVYSVHIRRDPTPTNLIRELEARELFEPGGRVVASFLGEFDFERAFQRGLASVIEALRPGVNEDELVAKEIVTEQELAAAANSQDVLEHFDPETRGRRSDIEAPTTTPVLASQRTRPPEAPSDAAAVLAAANLVMARAALVLKKPTTPTYTTSRDPAADSIDFTPIKDAAPYTPPLAPIIREEIQ